MENKKDNNSHINSRKSKTSRVLPSSQRRNLLRAIPSLFLFPGVSAVMAQQAMPVAVRKLHSFTIRVSDLARSLSFYQDLFAAPVQARQGDEVLLRIGSGPQHFRLRPVRAGEAPGFSSIGLSVEDFDLDRVRQQLIAFGVTPGSPPEPGDPQLSMAMRSWVVERGPGEGGASSGTRELYFADIEGIRYHLTALDYCGGSGPQGSSCSAPEPAPAEAMFNLVDLSHFTTFLASRDRANDFYRRAFGKNYQAYQGPGAPVIGVGDGLQFLMYVGGSSTGAPASAGRIDHSCFSVTDFNVERILTQLTDYGLSPRQDANDTGPLMHWVSMRMPNRGGAAGGTPELYFTDPDGIRIQLQDPGYCGGTGYLGDQCPPLA